MNEFDTTLSMLQSRYKKATLTKKELAYELSLSESTISNRISKGLDLPNYKKLGAEKSSKVVFPIIEVAKYLSVINNPKPNNIINTKHKLYGIWKSQRSRCMNKNISSYMDYGGRGIKFSSEFDDFSIWLQHIESLKDCQKQGYTLDRIDNDGHYERGNLRWVSRSTQALNRRKRKGSVGIYNGIMFDKKVGKWRSGITIEGKRVTIGYYVDEKDAAIARDRYVIEKNLPNNTLVINRG